MGRRPTVFPLAPGTPQSIPTALEKTPGRPSCRTMRKLMRSNQRFPFQYFSACNSFCFFLDTSLSQHTQPLLSNIRPAAYGPPDYRQTQSDCQPPGNIIYSRNQKILLVRRAPGKAPAACACYSSAISNIGKTRVLQCQKGAIAVLERPKVAYNTTTKKYVLGSIMTTAAMGLAAPRCCVKRKRTRPLYARRPFSAQRPPMRATWECTVTTRESVYHLPPPIRRTSPSGSLS